ncbi:hypothetical protein VPG91_11645 [Nitrospirillum amazonense]|uniref:hypothetical protein n=1 Tax=Nitrospirillum amazonense TaxID=28077 RepID=UPI002DD41B92|nr:hypothetical protein [Nitrospirillum amazonense]MEC4591643.1 hypothetical protein [Nitrospirillum amazonense]
MLRSNDIVNFYKDDRYIHRWCLVNGYPRCIDDAFEVEFTPKAAVLRQQRHNDDLRAIISGFESYESGSTLYDLSALNSISGNKAEEILSARRGIIETGPLFRLILSWDIPDFSHADEIDVRTFHSYLRRVNGELPAPCGHRSISASTSHTMVLDINPELEGLSHKSNAPFYNGNKVHMLFTMCNICGNTSFYPKRRVQYWSIIQTITEIREDE